MSLIANPQKGHGPGGSGRGAGRLTLSRRRSSAVPSISGDIHPYRLRP